MSASSETFEFLLSLTVLQFKRMHFYVALMLFTDRIARSASCRYLIYSEADFEVFRPAGSTRCTDGAEIWHGGGEWGPSSMPNFTPIGATTRV